MSHRRYERPYHALPDRANSEVEAISVIMRRMLGETIRQRNEYRDKYFRTLKLGVDAMIRERLRRLPHYCLLPKWSIRPTVGNMKILLNNVCMRFSNNIA